MPQFLVAIHDPDDFDPDTAENQVRTHFFHFLDT
ncbi:hypothetical protein L1274_004337 [Duganella sp. HSC-15S17]|uniref:Uncharacterized protein n=1 Tax=Duganella violaceipulchra TaxID=2849652 RepID=A0ABT1GNP1_9BURK|nr:hypothetical protein [Duganella violaceicalia]